jgi:hypothetical protein
MTDSRNPDQLIRAFLSEGVEELPDRVFDSVRDQLRHNHQRVVIGPWRTPLMTNTIRIAVAAAAVLVVAFIGFQFFGGTNVGGPAPSPSQSESPTLEPTPSPSATPAAAFPPAGAMAVGTHSMTLAGVPLSMELTATGWRSNGDFGFDKGNYLSSTSDAASFILWPQSAADNTFGDPCTETPLDPPAGPSAAERAAAVSTLAGIELVSGPTAVTVGGHPAQHVVIKIPDTIGCAPDKFYLWYDADDPTGELGRYATALGSTIYVWIIDVDGTIVWIDGETYATSGSGAAQEVEQIVNSIQFE